MARSIYLLPIDLVDRLHGADRPAGPPRAHNASGSVIDFEGSGSALRSAMSDLAGMTPSSRVLDVGCGMGRLAGAMATYLDADGSYDGIDIIPDAVKWCSENIVGEHDNVHFWHSDVVNGEYNPKGKIEAVDFRFPFEDETFDVVVLDSVFTHMVPADVEHYLAEITRVLKSGGRCFATFFLLTEKSRALMSNKNSTTNFRHNLGAYSVTSTKVPELAVAYEEQYVSELYARLGLVSDHRPGFELHPGFWCGQPSKWTPTSGTGLQDILVATKSEPSPVAAAAEHDGQTPVAEQLATVGPMGSERTNGAARGNMNLVEHFSKPVSPRSPRQP
jgi:ubiquinone/menaquinone biosynthesis C-methylase UbiE